MPRHIYDYLFQIQLSPAQITCKAACVLFVYCIYKISYQF